MADLVPFGTVQRRAWILGVVTLLLTACGGGSSVNPQEVGPCPVGREITDYNSGTQ